MLVAWIVPASAFARIHRVPSAHGLADFAACLAWVSFFLLVPFVAVWLLAIRDAPVVRGGLFRPVDREVARRAPNSGEEA